MRKLSLLAVIPTLLLALLVSALDKAANPDWEGRAIVQLANGDRPDLEALSKAYLAIAPEERGKLPVRIRADEVEFVFRGTFPGDQAPWTTLEYLASTPGKNYESLLVASKAELERLQALRLFFQQQPAKGRGKLWSARLAWVENDKPESVCVSDLLAHLKANERDGFLDQIGVDSAGLGGSINIVADAAHLPRKPVPAILILTLRMPPKKK